MWLPFVFSAIVASSHENPENSFISYYALPRIACPKSADDTLKPKIFERVKRILIDKLGVKEELVTPDASLTHDLGADSLEMAELIKEFEKEFQISMPGKDAAKM